MHVLVTSNCTGKKGGGPPRFSSGDALLGLNHTGRYVFAVNKIDLIGERIREFNEFAGSEIRHNNSVPRHTAIS